MHLERERLSTPRVRLTRAFQRAMRERAKAADSSSFSVHGAMVMVVLSMLLFVNARTSSDILWSLIPFSGGVTGVLHYYYSIRARRRDARETAALPPLDDAALGAVQSLISARTRLRRHFAVTTTGAVLAVVTGLLFTPVARWLIPAAGAMSVAPMLHYGILWRRQRQVRRLLRQAGAELGAAQPDATAAAAVPESVIEVCDRILDDLDGLGEAGAAWRQTIEPDIDTYLHQLHRLARVRAELDRANAGMMESWKIEAELARMRRYLRGDRSADLQQQ